METKMTPLVRRSVPEAQEQLQDIVQRQIQSDQELAFEKSLETAQVRDLLIAAQELLTVRDPANDRINRIRGALINKLSPVYDSKEQLTGFEEQDGFVFRDPDDNERIVIQHPDVGLFFRLKKTQVIKWKEVQRSITQEIARINDRVRELRLVGHPTKQQEEDLASYLGRRAGLQWVLEQTNVRKGYRLLGQFMARSDAQSEEGEEQ
jgi:hypothetical protein